LQEEQGDGQWLLKIPTQIFIQVPMKIQNIVCIGAGYVGGPTMAVIADRCPHLRVTVLDINADRIAQWNSDHLPMFEPGLDAVVARCRGKNLFFATLTPELIRAADVVFVSVNTPTKTFGEGAGRAADLQYLEKSARFIKPHLKPGTIIVEKSTVPIRTAQALSTIFSYGQDGGDYPILSNPEFLAEGTAIRDLESPDRVLIGSSSNEQGRKAAQALADVYAHWIPKERILLTNVWSSELSKLAANAFLAQRISSINSISALCEVTGADVGEIAHAIGVDQRIGPRFLEASVGFGGSCFRKDLLNLSYLCEAEGLKEVAAYWSSVVEMNDYQINRFIRRIIQVQFNSIAGKKIALLGFAYKPGTNDTRDAPAIRIATGLLKEKAVLTITDPKALDNARLDLQGLEGTVHYEADPYKATEGAHAVALLTHWPEYRALDYKKIFAGMEKPAFIFDGRNWLDHQALFKMGFNVYPLGKTPLSHI